MSAVEGSWRRLGSVLVEAGLISEEDLVAALAAQEGSARPLGEILVTRGLVSSAAIANALAEQRGSFFRSEHGFGTGLRSLRDPERGSTAETSEPEPPPLSDPQTPTTPEPSEIAGETIAPGKPESEHLLLVPTPQGYLFLEQGGAAPKVGQVIELPEVRSARFVVAKLTSSPLPQDGRVCAYLQPLE
jgi:hypothetical protein